MLFLGCHFVHAGLGVDPVACQVQKFLRKNHFHGLGWKRTRDCWKMGCLLLERSFPLGHFCPTVTSLPSMFLCEANQGGELCRDDRGLAIPNMSSACHNRMLPIWSQFSLKVWSLRCQSLSPKCFRILIQNCTHVDHVCMHSGQLVSRIHQSSAFLTYKHNIYKCTYMYICTLPQPSITPFKAYVFDGLCYPLLVNLHKSLVLLQCWSCFPHLLAILLVAPIILSGRQKSRMWSSRTCLRSGILR